MPPKLKVRPPKDDEGVPPGGPQGVPPPNDGEGCSAGVPPPNDGNVSRVSTLVAAASNPYIDSLSPLEQHVCRIAESHLQSSFDLSRSTGYLAWKAKNGMK